MKEMEYVGKTVKKKFPGYGVFSGVVNSYDVSSGFFEILYEDGDSEDLEMYELALLIDGTSMNGEQSNAEAGMVAKKPRVGRKPKRQRHAEPKSGNSSVNLVSCDVDHVKAVENLENECRVSEDSKDNAVRLKDDLDMNLNDEIRSNNNSIDRLNLNVTPEENREETRCIDLNLNVEGDIDENQNGSIDNEMKTEKIVRNFNLNVGVDEEIKDDCDENLKIHELVHEFHINGSLTDCECDEESSYSRVTNTGKKRKISDNLTPPPKEQALRRSARRRTNTTSTEETPAISIGERPEEIIIPLVKLKLPPSSQNLNVEGVTILDIFSIYTCLRSFSYLLFLSPFELEDFVASIVCKSPNSLLDFVHVSILQILKKHLEFLSEEGSQSASCCLRSIDWGLLDLITWPLFAVEYLLIHGSTLRPKFNFSQLNLECNYYSQPPCVKVEILRCLCDDVIEVEAIRSELNRRSADMERSVVGFDRNSNLRKYKRRFSLGENEDDETTDWNSDECCLCKMDGSLICCDGCPAAYHSRCVGVSSELLPEGKWYCPECLTDMDKPWTAPRKSIRGAELLGLDPEGRSYYHTCGYLLVSQSWNLDSSVSYYHINDLGDIIQALKSSDIRFGSILNAISKHWNITVHYSEPKSNDCHQNQSLCSVMDMKSALVLDFNVPDLSNGDNSNPNLVVTNDIKISENLELENGDIKNCQKREQDRLTKSQVDCSKSYVNFYCFAQIASLVFEELTRKPLDKLNISAEEVISMHTRAISKICSKFCWPNIPNINLHIQKENCGWCYSCKTPDDGRECLVKINMTAWPVQEGSNSEGADLQSKFNMKGHLFDIVCHILCLEDRLRGLLLGPWLNPHYSEHWRKLVLHSLDVAAVKKQLLTLVTNLHHRALSTDWLKPVDSVVAMGSASHIMTSSISVASKQGMGRKTGKILDFESVLTSKIAPGLTLYWWRGGRISRCLFNWKVLPQLSARRAARKSGCTKVPEIVYSDSSDLAKRNKNVAWRASFDASTSPEQLAVLVRDLDSYIMWDIIENTHPLSKTSEFKKSMKFFKNVVIRRKITEEGTVVKYLLDFGKRKKIPDIVIRNGSMLEESSRERKKYWLEESLVPLHLLKSFEEKQIFRKGNKAKYEKIVCDNSQNNPSIKKGFSYLFSRAEKSENRQCGHCGEVVSISEAVSCQYCEGFFHKSHVGKWIDVATAVCVYTCYNCQEGAHAAIQSEKGKVQEQPQINKRKVSINTQGIHSNNDKYSRVGIKLVTSRNEKNAIEENPLRRSVRKLKILPLQKKKVGRPKKHKQATLKKMFFPKFIKDTPWQKRRMQTCRSYWLRGRQLSKKPNDERLMVFRKKKLVLPFQDLAFMVNLPKCSLCFEVGYKAALSYICCEVCEDWFHGDAYELNSEIVNNLIGFRCHSCLNKVPPPCPHLLQINGTHSAELKSNEGRESSVDALDDFVPALRVYARKLRHNKKRSFMDQKPNQNERLDST